MTEVLVVDDERATRTFLKALLVKAGYRCTLAENGEQALNLLEDPSRSFKAMLLDRQMPGIEGLEVLRRIKRDARLRALPVVLLTVATQPEEVIEGLSAGAFYYLSKPVDPLALVAVLRTATANYSRYLELQDFLRASARTFTLLESGTFRFRTSEEAFLLIQLLAAACPDPDGAMVGLSELALNAIEHGNLDIGYEQKGWLVASGTLRVEVERRLQDPVMGARRVTLHVQRVANLLCTTFIDEGKGFDWQAYAKPSPERLLDNHGRGIIMAKASGFSRLEYLGKGNTVLAEILLPE